MRDIFNKSWIKSLKAPLVYFVVSGMWIILSDQLLFLLIKDNIIITKFQSIKGILFLIFMTFLLFWISRMDNIKENRIRKSLIAAEERYRQLLDSSPNFILVQVEEEFVYANKAALKNLGANSPDELTGKSFLHIIPSDYHETVKSRMKDAVETGKLEPFEYPIIRLDGKKVYFQLTITKMVYMGKTAFMSVGTDVTERKNMEEKLQYMAYHDKLTGLPNRYMLNEHLPKSLERCKTNKQKLAILFLDLDRFKFINDIKGHNVGDEVLKQVTDRLIHAVRTEDMITRLGGDEFIIVLENIEKEEVKRITTKVLKAFTRPFKIDSEDFFTSPSIGISMFPDDGEDGETLIKNADIAMYEAKKRGKNNFQFFIQKPKSVMDRKIKLERGLRTAIDNNEFTLFYQPKYELKTGRITGIEALIRWNHPVLGFVLPSEFIPIAEEIGLIVDIGKWVIETACQQNKKWREQGIIIRIAVNVSPLQFEASCFSSIVKQIIDETQMPPELLEIEITEGIMQNLSSSSRIINELKKLGVKISLDDFGTGYSSLSVLNHLPIDYLKIDKSFVNEIHLNDGAASLVKTIIDIGENLKFDLIAEGIETEEQLDFLKKNGCQHGQGYLYSPPIPDDQIEVRIKEQFIKI